MQKKIQGIIIAGPTGVGKTALSIEVAKLLDAEVISADSMQIYRGMDIGTAKARQEEKQGIPHHLLDMVDPQAAFSVAEFQREALEVLKDVCQRGKVPVVTGGTGLYINALIYDMDFNQTPPDFEIRRKLDELYQKEGGEALVHLLEKVDLDAAKRIDLFNTKRVLRALEVGLSKQKVKDFSSDPKKREDMDFRIFILFIERSKLYQRINLRVDKMLNEGLLEEVRGLKEAGLTQEHLSMKAIGYRQMLRHIDGEISFEEAVDLIKTESRRYAKRQLTWFKRYPDAQWLDMEELSVEEASQAIQKSFLTPFKSMGTGIL